MALESLKKLYNGVSSQQVDIGDFDTFKSKMQSSESRRKFYDQVSGLGIDIGDYETFELKVSSPSPSVDVNEFFVDPNDSLNQQDSFKQSIYDSVKRQENSIATNNPYGVNLPRKKSNVDKIASLGGKVMEGSQTLLEFDSLDNGLQVGEEIIDNILNQTNNDPSKFYSSYSGLPEDSPEVKSFVEIFNEQRQKYTPKQETNLDRIIRALEQGKQNPQYIMKTASEPDAVDRLTKSATPLPKFVMGIPTSEITTAQVKRRERLTPKEIAQAQNKLFLQREIAKEKKKGLSERDAYRKVVSSAGGTPPSVVNLAMEKSITGAVFRIMNLNQTVMLDDYPQAEIKEVSDMVSLDFLEQVVSGAVAMVMPVDAMLFGLGGKAGAKVGQKSIEALPQLKRISKFADEAARLVSKGTNTPLPQVRVLAKEAVHRMTGGAGGFGAFDAGRNIVDQIENTGEIDVVEALEATLKGMVIGGSVGSLGFAGAKAGNLIGSKTSKAGEFSAEVFGLGTVAPVIEGEPITKQGYVEAAGTIIGLKFLKQFSAENQRRITESLGEEIQRRTEQSGKRMDEVANEIGDRLKTSFELAIEGKSPEKSRSVMIDKGMEFDLSVKKTEKPLSEDPSRPLRVTDVLVSEKVVGLKGVKEPGSVEYTPRNQTRPERMQIESDIRRLASDMKTLEKNGAQQKLLDDMQNSIDAKVAKLNEIAVERKDIENLFTPPEVLKQTQRRVVSTEQVAKDVVESRLQFQERVKGLESQLASRDKAEQKRLEAYLKEKDIYNRPFEPNPFLEVPLHPADAGRRVLESIQSPKQTVQQLPTEKKLKGFEIQKEFTDLDLTVKANETALQNPNLTPMQKQRLEASNQKAKELLRDTQDRANIEGLELQMFMGIPTPSILKSLFGSSKKRPRALREQEVERLYNQAIKRLDKKIENEGIKVETQDPVSVEPIRPQGFGEKVYNVFFSDLIERTANVGTQTSIQAAESGRRAIDITKETYGRLAPTLDVILKQSGKMFGAEGKAVRELSEFVEVDVGAGNKVLMSNLHAGIEGYPVKLSKEAKKQIEKIKDLIEERGKIFEEIGLMQEGADGKIRPFKVIGRNIAPRIMSGEFYTIIQRGPNTKSNEYNILVSEFAKANGATEKQVRDYFNEFRDNFTGSGGLTLQGGVPASRPTRTTQAEHSRKWKHIPQAIKVGKDLIPIVEYRPFEYARRLVETGSSRVGVAKVFGQELAGTSTINKIKEQLSNEGVSVVEFHEMIKGLSGVPIEPSLVIGTSKGVRAINATYDVLKTTSLSASAIPNLGEFLGSTRRFAGTAGLAKALFDLKLGLPTAKAKQLEAYLDSIGAITKDIANFSIDPNRPVSSFIRALNEAQRSAFVYRYMNQLQEATAAVVAFNKVETYKQGKGKNIDKIFLREMGFSREDARLMVSGNAPQRLYDALIRRAPAHLTGGAQRVGEQSRAESSRIFKALTAFETYAQMKIRSLNRVAKTYGTVTREAFAERNYGKAVDAHRALLSEFYGLAISGLTAQFALSYFYGGEDNVEIKYNEAKDDPFRALIDAWTYTAFGGIYGQILKATGGDVGIDRLYPITVMRETVGAVTGTGRYTYDEGMDRAIKFGERFAPANKAFKNALVTVGLGSPEARKSDNAIRAYYRWKIENKYGGKYTSVPDENIKKFRTNMIKAYEAFRKQKPEREVYQLLMKAVTESGKDLSSVSSSLNGKRLLTKSKIAPGAGDEEFTKRKNELKKRIGQEAYNRLVIHDELLSLIAEDF